MKKIFKILSVAFLLICSSTILFACDKQETYTEQEIILETKNCLKDEYNLTTLYNVNDLPQTYTFQNKYKTYVEWFSSDNTIVDITNLKINRTLEKQNCILTAKIYYKNSYGEIDLSFIIPPNLYNSNALHFTLSQETPIAIKSLSYIDYENFYQLSATLSFYNNIGENRTLTGIELSFYIYDETNTKLTYETQTYNIEFNTPIFYQDHGEYTLTISSYYMANRIELTTHKFYISATIENYTSGIGYSN